MLSLNEYLNSVLKMFGPPWKNAGMYNLRGLTNSTRKLTGFEYWT